MCSCADERKSTVHGPQYTDVDYETVLLINLSTYQPINKYHQFYQYYQYHQYYQPPLLHQLQTNRIRHINLFADRIQLAGLLVPLKDHDVIGFLVGHQQEIAGWIDGKIPGYGAHRRLVAQPFQLAICSN